MLPRNFGNKTEGAYSLIRGFFPFWTSHTPYHSFRIRNWIPEQDITGLKLLVRASLNRYLHLKSMLCRRRSRRFCLESWTELHSSKIELAMGVQDRSKPQIFYLIGAEDWRNTNAKRIKEYY